MRSAEWISDSMFTVWISPLREICGSTALNAYSFQLFEIFAETSIKPGLRGHSVLCTGIRTPERRPVGKPLQWLLRGPCAGRQSSQRLTFHRSRLHDSDQRIFRCATPHHHRQSSLNSLHIDGHMSPNQKRISYKAAAIAAARSHQRVLQLR